MARKRTIVITGAGGFIGGHLARHFLSLGHEVRAADIKPLREWYQVHRGAENFAGPGTPAKLGGDCRDYSLCRVLCRGASEVYQLAADMGGMGFIENNKALCMLSVLTNTHMLLAAQEAGVDRFFYASSACVYNADKQRDPNITALKEADAYPALPEDGYGWEKLFSERMCRHFREDFGIHARGARFHNVYGPHGTWDGGREKAPAAVCRKVIAAVVSGQARDRDLGRRHADAFVHVHRRLHQGHRLITHSDSGADQPRFVGDGLDQPARRHRRGHRGRRLKRNYKLDAPRGVAGRNSDNAKIMEYLGWQPSTRLRDGMEATYRWIHGEFVKKYRGKTAAKQTVSSFAHGSRPIPGDGYNAESQRMKTWRQGIPATYGKAKAAKKKAKR
jgi:GDP-D-mannose 3',5'-epimerase